MAVLSPALGFAEGGPFALEVAVGGGGSGWTYDKGSTDPALANNLGWDRTVHSPSLPLELNGSAALGRWRVGVGVNYSFIFVRQMHVTGFSRQGGRKYPISRGTLHLGRAFLLGEVALVRHRAYRMGPNLRLGFFRLDSIHPERDNFGRKVFWAIGIANEIRLGAFGLILRPQRTVGLMRSKEKKNRHEGHQIHSTEFHLGLKYWL